VPADELRAVSVVVEAGDDAFYVPVPAVLPLLAFGLALAGASEPAHLRRTRR
jgi:hypothetical protein